MTSMDVLVVSGGVRFSDQWHSFADTSAELAAALRARQCAVTISDDADAALSLLGSRFAHWPLWREIAGGGWTRGTTYHPDYGPGTALASPSHPLTTGLDRLEICDERYTQMWVDDRSAVYWSTRRAGIVIRWPGLGSGTTLRSWRMPSGMIATPTARPAGQACCSANSTGWLHPPEQRERSGRVDPAGSFTLRLV